MGKIFSFVVILFCLYPGSQVVQAQSLQIASYNIRYDNPGDVQNPWKERLPVIVKLIKFHDFDIFGSQEGLHHQLDDLARGLGAYAYTGVGRDDGKEAGEFSAIFYKNDKFTLLQNGNFWLSTDTSKPNKGWDAALPRICSWGQFQVKDSGFRFYFFNVHFDHKGVEARRESSKLILEQIRKIAGSSPVILSGDFNIDQMNESYRILNSSKTIKSAYDQAALVYAPNGTFNAFDINSKSDSRIDHIFLTPHFKVQKYGILTDSYQGKFPSDHFPVLVQVTY
ncbi:endonuclease/exonuclease/phosphatase family protein [Cesiribacter sp. SM1]|uniref:endonuclease/exonuclease/phosphatase family protein n=1 Tax=Cesiribacter sp. SM1 TaxID=2861196 RepID=UPI001CD7F73F|nr:endonuclease/exonuclease/phosphatase family protein [Cesiribacter sp. SM1]